MRLFLSPTRPQQAAGMRIEPPPSEPWAIGTIPAATAAAAPPEDPPGVRPVSQGLRVGPCRRGSVTGRIPNSGRFVLPTTTKPASRMRRTTKASCCGTKSPNSSEPAVMGSPLTGAPSLIAIGTPANGRSSPGPIASAAARALSASTWTKALISPSSAPMASSDVRTSSRELTSPERIMAASSVAGLNMSSLTREPARSGAPASARAPARAPAVPAAPQRAPGSRLPGRARSRGSTRRAPRTRRSGPSAG